ncbi:MAG: molybdopterin-guanine dinucleotide biosynthesis protein A [Candidatus Latescibacterota bacterium]|jgi:molybdopterin-guanine dinucleotide biosynthesis protein A
MKRETTTGIILAGGKSSRMGRDKGLLALNGRTFMSHIIEALEPVVNDIIIVSNNSDYDIYKLKRIADILKDSGPLAGLYTGLFHSETENNIVLSCDVPLINTAVLNILIEGFETEKDVIHIKSEEKNMPLIAIYKKKCMPHFLKRLHDGERRLQTAIDNINTKSIPLEPAMQRFVKNINTASDLKEITNGSDD